MDNKVQIKKTNGDIITLLDEWLLMNRKKSVQKNCDIVVFLKEYGKINLEEDFDSIFSKLEKWAKANKKIILVTSATILVVSLSSLALNSYYTSKTKQMINDNLEPGIHYVEDGNNIIEYYREIRNKSLTEQRKLEEKREIRKIEEQKKLEEERVKEEKTYIQLYSDIYGLDYEKVYQILSDITDNFQDENYVNNYVIGESMMKKKYVTCTSKEMAILIAVRNLYFTPTLYNSSYEDLKIEKVFSTDLSYSYQISYITNVLGLDPALSYAICKSECNFNSSMFRNKNNPGGIKFGDTFATFPNKTAGFIEQSLILLSYKISGIETIEAIGKIYAPVSIQKENETTGEKRERELNSEWVSNVTSIYYSALNQYEDLFGDVNTISLLKPKEITEEEIFIKQYSDIYGLDYEKVYQILSILTNNFESELYKKEYIIGKSKLNHKFVMCHSKEMAILLAIRNIYFYPEEYGYSSSELKTNIPYKSELDYANQIAYVSKVLDVDTAINYTICKMKSNFNSPMFLTKNNPNNIKSNGIYVTFPSPMAGFIEEGLNLLEYKLDGKALFEKIEKINFLTEDYKEIATFMSIYHYVMKNYDDIFREEITLNNEKVYVLE